MGIEFKIVTHREMPTTKLVEVWVDNGLLALIVPDGNTLEIRSHNFVPVDGDDLFPSVERRDGTSSFPSVPSVVLLFNPELFPIQDRRIVRD